MPVRSTPTPQLQHDVDLSTLNRDVEVLIAAARNEFANNPLDPSIQQRLKALLDLQGIMQRQQLTQEQLKLVRDQVSALAPKPIPASQPASSHTPITSTPAITTPPVVQSFSQPLQQLLNPGTLAELIKATAARQQPTPPPQIPPALQQMPLTSSTPQIPTSAPENPLIAALRAKGLLPATSTPPASAPNMASPFPFIVPGQVRYTPPVPTPQMASMGEVQVNVQMNTASIKM
jgi:pre-mRNA cleavage complex 2 protein Pcf11